MKKFIDIERIKPQNNSNFESGDQIVIQTKIDGSNASFCVVDGKVCAFSRRQELSEKNTLNGFLDLVMTFDTELVSAILGERYVVFGEWLTSHKIKYSEDMYKKFYMYDVWDKEEECYLPSREVLKFYKQLFLNNDKVVFVKNLYEGEFTTWEAALEYLKVNIYNSSPCSEGIVVKNQSKLKSKSRFPFYLKIVNEQFSEVMKTKPVNTEKLKEKERQEAIMATVITRRRIEKGLEKLIEDKLIPENWDETNMKDIAKLLPRFIYNDIVKEEPETVSQCDNAGKICSSITMRIVREILNELMRVN